MREKNTVYVGLSFSSLVSFSPFPLELWVLSGKLSEMIWSPGTYLGGKPGIHLFLVRSGQINESKDN